ncbi:MAG: rod shape-determining protein MreD, partial [Actinomycetota bacterium]|nr:rod shape-determining protein MreD [Actinomycetota bacterium]
MTSDPRFRVPLLFLVALAVHLALIPVVRVAGATPDVMLLLAVAGGLVGGPVRGAILGFAAGIAVDVFLRTPMGLSALVFTLVGYSVGTVSTGVLSPSWYLPVVTASIASAAGVVLFAFVGAMLGEPMVNRRLVTIVSVVAVGNAVLAVPMIRAVTWAMGGDSGPVPEARGR